MTDPSDSLSGEREFLLKMEILARTGWEAKEQGDSDRVREITALFEYLVVAYIEQKREEFQA